MPIPTNPNFNTANGRLARRPLYVLEIDGVFEPLTTFRYEDYNVSLGGYGVSGYGILGYGI
jgi:hypothetical protein